MVKKQRDALIAAWIEAAGLDASMKSEFTAQEKARVTKRAEQTVDKVIATYALKRASGEMRDMTARFKEERVVNPKLVWATFEREYLKKVVTATAQAQSERVKRGLPI